jgi:hypothetical protein
MSSPGPRISRSRRAISKPSVVSPSRAAGRAGGRQRRRVQQHAHAGHRAAADPAAQLVQLRQAEALGVLDHHQAGVGHVHADLDHRGGHQHLHRAR